MATNLTFEQLQAILNGIPNTGATNANGTGYEVMANSMNMPQDQFGDAGTGLAAPGDWAHAGIAKNTGGSTYDQWGLDGTYQGNHAGLGGYGKFTAQAIAAIAAAYAGGQGLSALGAGGAAGGVGAGQFGGLAALDTAAQAAQITGGLSASDAALIASLGDGTFAAGAGGLGSSDAALIASLGDGTYSAGANGIGNAGGTGGFQPINMSVPNVPPITGADIGVMSGGDAALGTVGGQVSPFTMSGGGAGGLFDGFTGADALKYGGALAGAISGFQGAPGGTTTSQRTLDPKIENAYFGADGKGGLLGSATAWFDKYKDTGMNDAMSSANAWQRGILQDPGLKAGLFSQGGNGVSLMNQPRTTNPFLNPSFNGKWGG